MYSKTASKRYAKALMDSATENNLLEETYSEINLKFNNQIVCVRK